MMPDIACLIERLSVTDYINCGVKVFKLPQTRSVIFMDLPRVAGSLEFLCPNRLHHANKALAEAKIMAIQWGILHWINLTMIADSEEEKKVFY
jgi:hypothetical protein